MTEFSRSNWARPEFSRGYRDNADMFIVDRGRMFDILRSFYGHFVQDGSPKRVLDLGCGDGIATAAIADIDPLISATLVDGSGDMLAKARERLNGFRRARYVHATFQDMLNGGAVRGPFDLAVSSLAIHHLTTEEKAALYEKIHALLGRGGHFVNIDVVLAPSPRIEKWYLSLWQDWIDERAWDLGLKDGGLENIVRRYKDNRDNKPDTLEVQLDALRAAGFRDVDCFYRHGIFTMFGGRKAA